MYKKAVVILFLAVSMSLVHLLISAKIASLGYKVDEGKKVLSKLRSENRSLAARIAQMESLPRIEEIARNKLKMITPPRIKYIVITGEAFNR